MTGVSLKSGATDLIQKDRGNLNRSILKKFAPSKKKAHLCTSHDNKQDGNETKKFQLAKLYTHVDKKAVRDYLKPKYDRS